MSKIDEIMALVQQLGTAEHNQNDGQALYFENEIRKAIEAIAQPARDEIAYREAVNLATALFRKHFSHEEHYASGQVVWEPCDTTAGVISQIDNMVCGLINPQPAGETEPVAEVLMHDGQKIIDASMAFFDRAPVGTMLYTTSQQSQPLTASEIADLWENTLFHITDISTATDFVRDVEAAHGIKGATE